MTSHQDARLHNYVGDIIQTRDYEVLVELRIKIGNEIATQHWVSLRDIRPL